MGDEVDEYGVVIKKKSTSAKVDEYGIPIKKKINSSDGLTESVPITSELPSTGSRIGGSVGNVNRGTPDIIPEINVADFNKQFEDVTGYKDFSLSEPVQATGLRGLLSDDLFAKRKEAFEQKKFKTYSKEKEKIDEVSKKIFFGDIQPEELSKLQQSPFGKNIANNIIKEYVPEITDVQDGNPATIELATKRIKEKNRINFVNAEGENIRQLDNTAKTLLSDFQLEADRGTDDIKELKSTLAITDFNNNDEISSAIQKIKKIDQLENSYYGMGSLKQTPELLESKRKSAEKNNAALQVLTDRLNYNVSRKGVSPSLNWIDDRIGQSFISKLNETDRGQELTDKLSNDKIKLNQFKLGLTALEKQDPVMFKNITGAIANEKKIADTDFNIIANIGQQIDNVARFRGGAYNPELIDSETRFDYTTFGQKKSLASAQIGEWFKSKGIKNLNEFSPQQIKQAASELGINNKEIVNSLIFDEKLGFYDAIPKSGWVDDIVAGIMQPLVGINSTISVWNESPAQTYLRSKSLEGTLGSAKVPNEKGEYSDMLPSERGKFTTNMFRGLGQFIPQVLLARGVGAGLKGATGLVGIPTTVNQAKNIADYGGTFISTFLQSYGQSYEEHLQKTGDEDTASLMGTIDGISSGAFELILPDVKIADKALSGLKQGLTSDLVGLVKKGGNPAELATKARPYVQKFFQSATNTLTQENLEELGTQYVDFVTESIFDPASAKDRNVNKELWETFKSTTAAMLLPSILGAGGGSFTKDFTTKSLHSAAINFDSYKESLQKSLDKEYISQDDFNKSVQVLSTHRESIANAPEINAAGKELTPEKRLDYAMEETKIKYYTEQEKKLGKVGKEMWNEKIKESEEIQRKILLPKELTKTEPAVITPKENKSTEIIEIAPKENVPTEKTKGAAIILPETAPKPNIIEVGKKTEENNLIQSVKDNSDRVTNPIYKNVLKNGTEKEVADALKEVSDQWHDEGSRQTTEETFGKPIVDAAIKLFPQENQKALEIPKENVSGSVVDVKNVNTTDYKGEHQLTELKTTANNLVNGGTGFDWEHVAEDHDLSDMSTKESYRVLKAIKDNPDTEVTIYRSVPKGIDKINEGDWITLSKNYATEHGMDAADASKDAPVISMKVKAKDIGWDGNDLNEFVYNPKSETQPTSQQTVNEEVKDKVVGSGVVDVESTDKALAEIKQLQLRRDKNIAAIKNPNNNFLGQRMNKGEVANEQKKKDAIQTEHDTFNYGVEQIKNKYPDADTKAVEQSLPTQEVKDNTVQPNKEQTVNSGEVKDVLKDVESTANALEAVSKNNPDLISNVIKPKGMIVYHGTPFEFDKFDISKLGTGEGNQAFGHGLYFTNKKEIAKDYSTRFTLKPEQIENEIEHTKNKIKEKEDFLSALESSPEDVKNRLDKIIGMTKSELASYKQNLEYFEKAKTRIHSNLMTVRIHGDRTPEQFDYLKWKEKPTAQQLSKIKLQVNGSDFSKWDFENGEDLYRKLSTALGSEKEASQLLLKSGIDGIEYFSEGGTGGKGGEGKDYVVFDPNAISIEEVNGIKKETNNISAKDIAELYHKSKADGSNPELVKAVEKALTPKTEKTGEVKQVTNTGNESTKPSILTPQEVGKIQEKETQTKNTKKFSDKIRQVAQDIREGKVAGFGKGMEGVQKQGFGGKSLNEAIAKSLDIVADAIDKGVEIAQAIEQGFSDLRDYYQNNTKSFDEEKLKSDFTKFVNDNYKSEIGITHADTKDIRIEQGLGEYEKTPETVAQWNEQANERIKNGELPALIKRLENGGGVVDGTEQTMLGKYIAAVNEKASKDPSNENLAELKKALLLNEIVGSQQFGQVGRARQETFMPEETLAKWMVDKMESLGVDELTDDQKTDVTEKFANYEAALKIESEKRAEAEEQISKLKAELALKTELEKRKTVRSKNTQSLKEERKEILTSIKEKLRKARGETNVTVLPYAKELYAIAPDVAKLVRNLVEEGAVKLEDIVDTVYTNLKDEIKDITKKDVNDLIAGEYNEKRKTKSELEQRLKDIKDEAALINKLEALENGELPKEPKKVIERNQQIKALREKIKDFEKRKRDAENEIKANERQAEKAKRDAELAEEKFIKDFEKEQESEAKKAAKAKLDEAKKIANDLEKELNKKTPEEKIVESLKKKNEKEFAQIVKDLANKNFETKKQTPIDYQAALKKVDPKLWKETMDAIAKRDEAKHLWELEKQRDELKKRGWGKKLLDKLSLGISTSKAIKAGIDDSITGIQLGLAIMSNPRAGVKAKWQAILDTNAKRFKRQLVALHESPRWNLIQESGLDITEPRSMHQNLAEELYSGNLLDRNFTVKGKRVNLWTYTGGVFERLFTSMGNNMRLNLFLARAEQLENSGRTFETHPQEFKDSARVINEMTGRGKMNQVLQTANPIITPIIWAPRLISSSLNLLGVSDITLGAVKKGFYQNLTPSQRGYAFRQMGRGIGVGVTIMAVAAMNGWDADDDPFSSTFGTIGKGTKRYNVFGRFSGVVKTIFQVLGGKRKTKFGEQDLDNPKYGGKSGGSVLGGFLRGKMTPFAGLLFDYKLNAKRNFFTKEPVNLAGLPDALLTPISVGDLRKGLEQDGSWSLLTRFLPAFEGINVTDERDFKSIPPETITHNGEEVKLNESQSTELDNLLNDTKAEYKGNLLATEEYQSATKEEKIELEKNTNILAAKDAHKIFKETYSEQFVEKSREEKNEEAAKTKELNKLIRGQ